VLPCGEQEYEYDSEELLGLEASWLERVAAGDSGAFEDLCRSYERRIFVYAYRMLNSREAAEEVTNDVLMAVWRGAKRFKGGSKVSTWIFGIARNKALTQFNRQKVDYDSETLDFVGGAAARQEKHLVEKDLVKQALDELSSEHREVVELTFFIGLSYKEIAEIMECPVNTVKTRMFYAKQRLRDFIAQRPDREAEAT
jgi:RNA polymerase sigma-70 factor (ECF subfamily)